MSFSAVLTVPQSNMTGDGTLAVLKYNSESYDAGSNYDPSTGIFTASVAGTYDFSTSCYLDGLSSAHTNACTFFYLNGSSNYYFMACNLGVCKQANNSYVASGSLQMKLNAGDTLKVAVVIANGAKTVNCQWGIFSGGLI